MKRCSRVLVAQPFIQQRARFLFGSLTFPGSQPPGCGRTTQYVALAAATVGPALVAAVGFALTAATVGLDTYMSCDIPP